MLFTAAAVSGCQSAQIAFPAGNEKSGFEKFDVKGRGGFALFSGKFTIGTVTVDWTRSLESSASKAKPFKIFGSNDETITVKKQDFTVSTTGAGIVPFSGKMSTDAEMIIQTTKTSKKTTSTSTEIIRNVLKGTFKSEGTVGEFSIEQKDQIKKGSFKGKDFNFIIESTNSVEGSSFMIYNTTGYYIYENNSLCAVVDIMNNGALYISKGIRKERIPEIYAAAAALLQYKDLASK
jgi:hypothetical protein